VLDEFEFIFRELAMGLEFVEQCDDPHFSLASRPLFLSMCISRGQQLLAEPVEDRGLFVTRIAF